MGTIQRINARLAKAGLLFALCASMSACAGLFGHTMSWKEEVKLHDGQVVVVERFFNLGGYPTLDSHNRSPLDETITFTVPRSTKSISWKTEYRNDLPEPDSLGPLLLDVVGGVPYLAASPAGCLSYNKWGRPNPPYVVFKYVDEQWKRIPLAELPTDLVNANLMSRPDSRILKSYYTAGEAKEYMQGRNIAAEARTILREPIKGKGGITGCGEMVFYKCGWIDPNGPIGRNFMDSACKSR